MYGKKKDENLPWGSSNLLPQRASPEVTYAPYARVDGAESSHRDPLAGIEPGSPQPQGEAKAMSYAGPKIEGTCRKWDVS